MSLDSKTRRAALEAAWKIVNETHWDPSFGGVNWAAAKKKHLPRALAAPTDAAFWGAVQEMLDELKQSHFAVLPPGAYTGAEAGGKRRSGGWSGATLTLDGRAVLVASVRGGSPAAEAKLTPGLEVRAIGPVGMEKALAPLLARKARPVELGLALRALEAGGVGETLPWRVVDETGAERTLSVTYGSPPGEIVSQLGLPPVPVESESKVLESGVWYFRFNIFLKDNFDAFKAALEQNRSAPALIIDLRGNPGGLAPITWGIASLVALWPGFLGKQTMRRGVLVFSAMPREDIPAFKGPVAILTDALSLSCSEVLAGGLQEMGRAKTVGRTTGGMVLPAFIDFLPGGARLEHAVADFKTPKGVLLEGRGVIPDIPVALTRKALLAEPDPDVAAALKWIATKIKR